MPGKGNNFWEGNLKEGFLKGKEKEGTKKGKSLGKNPKNNGFGIKTHLKKVKNWGKGIKLIEFGE